jgi:hypothetical protein
MDALDLPVPDSWLPVELRDLAAGVLAQAIEDGDRTFFSSERPGIARWRAFWRDVAELDEVWFSRRVVALLDAHHWGARAHVRAPLAARARTRRRRRACWPAGTRGLTGQGVAPIAAPREPYRDPCG